MHSSSCIDNSFNKHKCICICRRDITIQENPPVYWQYGGEIIYNKEVRDTTVCIILSVIWPCLSGWSTAAKGTFASSITSIALNAGITGDFNIVIKKIAFYKINTDDNGYLYYCHDVVRVYKKNADGTLTYLDTYENFYYSYTYPQYS